MKKYLSLCLLALFLSAACQNNKKAEKEDVDPEQADTLERGAADEEALHIRRLIENFVAAYNAKDKQAINALFHPEHGLIVVHRPGAMDWFESVHGIDFEKPVPSYHDYAPSLHSYPLQFGSLPVYSCATESWDKLGFFVDTLTRTNIVMPIADQLNEFEDVEFDPDYATKIQVAEEGSYRVVLTTEAPLVFHVKKIDGQWYVTILDRAYGDCSA